MDAEESSERHSSSPSSVPPASDLGFRVRVSLTYGDCIEAHIDICSDPEAYRLKARRYRRLLRAKEQEVSSLREQLQKLQQVAVPAMETVGVQEEKEIAGGVLAHTPSLVDDSFATETEKRQNQVRLLERSDTQFQLNPATDRSQSADESSRGKIAEEALNFMRTENCQRIEGRVADGYTVTSPTAKTEETGLDQSFRSLCLEEKLRKQIKERLPPVLDTNSQFPLFATALRQPVRKQKVASRLELQSPEGVYSARPKSEIKCRHRSPRSPLSKLQTVLSPARNHSLHSTAPSFTDLKDPAVRQTLAHYLQTHRATDLFPTHGFQSVARLNTPKRKTQHKSVPRPHTPISELVFTEKVREKEEWSGLIKNLRDHPELMRLLINSPPHAGTERSADISVMSQRQRSGRATAQLSLLPGPAKAYRAVEISRRVSTPRADRVDINKASRNQPVRVAPDWILSPLSAEAEEGRLDWEKDNSMMTVQEIGEVVKKLKTGEEGRRWLSGLPLLEHRAKNTLRTLQRELLLPEFSTLASILEVLGECLRLLRLRQVTLTVLHCIHLQETQPSPTALTKALQEWFSAFPHFPVFLYRGCQYTVIC